MNMLPQDKRKRQSGQALLNQNGQALLNQNGQALLILLLILAASLTLVLSNASRSITDVQSTALKEDSQRAFSAAEVGIEQALLDQVGSNDTLDNSAVYDTDYVLSTPTNDQFVHPSTFSAGETATFWFVSQDSEGDLNCDNGCMEGNQMRLCWGVPGTVGNNNGEAPAIEVSVFYDSNLPQAVDNVNFTDVVVARTAFDPNGGRNDQNGFEDAGNCNGGLGGQTFPFSANVLFNNAGLGIPCRGTEKCLLMARIKFLYNELTPHPIGIRFYPTGGTNPPPQGAEIDSLGSAGSSSRKINVFQTYGSVPAIFDSAVYSEGALEKN